DATFGLPEVDRGALGAATHLSRLVPQQRMRSMVYTAQPATAAELHHYGSVLRVVPRDPLVDPPHRGGGGRRAAGRIRREAGRRHHEVGHVTGRHVWPTGHRADRARGRGTRGAERQWTSHTGRRRLMADKRLSLEDLTGELHSGMTIGIGGWGARRKRRAAVRAILRSDLSDLTVVSYGGPDVGLLCAAGKVAKVVFGFVTLDSIPTDPHFKVARQTGAVEAMEIDEGMFYLGLLAASQRVPFLPTRAGLGSDVMRVNPSL